ncbi:MAG: fumarate hydratase [Spirochaetes bacterium]|nr:fumarate hydratase [Spirochaetota bacterium]
MVNSTKENLRRVSVKVVENAIYEGIVNITHKLPEDIKKALKDSYESEVNPKAKYILNQLISNYDIALKERIPLCQDTGSIILFIEVGQDVYFTDGYILSGINKAIARATTDKYLRSSIVHDPITRKNNHDNTPAVIHIEYARGNRVKLYIMAKGAGAENVSVSRMLPLSYASKDKIKDFILKWVTEHAAKACPPVIVGIGIGGTYDYCPVLAKKALLRKIGSKNKNSYYDKLEKELLSEINKSNIGPQGIGGKTTSLGVFIESHPCHIASLPVSINITCNSSRITKIVI